MASDEDIRAACNTRSLRKGSLQRVEYVAVRVRHQLSKFDDDFEFSRHFFHLCIDMSNSLLARTYRELIPRSFDAFQRIRDVLFDHRSGERAEHVLGSAMLPVRSLLLKAALLAAC